jgi:DNA-binding transcriptional LysR family regulator
MADESLPFLETFARAAESGSFTATARALGLTQAAVSQRIQALEKSLNAALFERQGGHVQLTAAGHRLYDYAQRILQLVEEARAELTGSQSALTGELDLAASSVPGEHLLPELLAEFRGRYPHVQVRAAVGDTRQVLEQVEHHDVHLGLVGGKIDNPHLEFQCFATDQLVLVVPPGHPWQRRKRVTLEQVCEMPLILREAGSASRWCLQEAVAAAGKALANLNVVLELGSNKAIAEAVQRGLGVAVLSASAVHREVEAGQLLAVHITHAHLVRDMFVVWSRRRALPIAARLFRDLLMEQHIEDSPHKAS